MAATPPPAAPPPPRLGNFVSPAAEKALFVAGHPGPLHTASRAALAAACAAGLPYLAHTVLPLALPGTSHALLAVTVDLLALLWFTRALSRVYLAFTSRDEDAALARMAPLQRKLLNLPEPRSFMGRPPLPTPSPVKAAAGDLRRRQSPTVQAPLGASPGGVAAPGSAGTAYGTSPAGSSPASSFGAIDSEADLEEYLRWSEAQRGANSPLAGDASLSWPLLSTYKPYLRPPTSPSLAGSLARSPSGGVPSLLGIMGALRMLHPRPDLDLWTDRLREWLAARVMQPLAVALQRSADDVASALAACPQLPQRRPLPLVETPRAANRGWGGWPGRANGYASPLGAAGQASPAQGAASPGGAGPMGQGASPGGGGGGGNPSPGGSGGGGGGYSYDSDAVEAELRYVGATLARVPRQQLSVQQAAALDAITRHVALLTLLRGSLPPGLVAPLPPGYVAHRVGALAHGTCLDAFVWDGGDSQLWSPELPDDSSLVLYLVTSFLLCPGWNFTLDHAGLTGGAAGGGGGVQGMMAAAAAPAQMAGGITAPGRGGPLFVGTLPPASRCPERYAAVLVAPLRPPEGAGGALALACARAAPPRFHVYGTGTELAVGSGHNGLFHALVLFFLAAEQLNGGALGPARLESPVVALSSIFTEPGARL